MTSESKILTVSYGTFSCTLEGFDNPFDTMKAIAEYFRDLAAQDRHFGAEPPPPDAAMLHRLAEREVSRLATAKAEEARLATAATPETPAPRIQINPVLRRPAPSQVAPDQQVEADTAATEPALTDVIPDGVAAKLARIRKSVNPTAAVAEASFTADAEVSEPALDAAEDLATTAFAPDVAEADLVAAGTTHPAEDVLDVATRLGELISSEPAAAPDHEAEDAVARATDLADTWTDGVPDAVLADTEAAPFVAVEAEDDLVTLVADDAPLAVEVEADAALTDDAPLPVEPDEVSLIDDAADAALTAHPVEDDFTAADVALLAQLDGTVFDEESLAASLDETLPEDQPAAMDLTDAALQDPLPEAIAAETSAEALPEDLVAEPQPEPETFAPSGKSGARTRRVNSRIVRIHPSEKPQDPGATRVLDNGEEANEIARLMQQADEVMAEEQNQRRQEALSRLKAAVAATEADRADIDYEAPKADANLNPYRDDLAEAIQPVAEPEPVPEPAVKPTRRKSVTIRPASEPRPGTIRPGMISPPPLVLVSEQRIDRLSPAAAAPAPAPAPAPASAPAMAPPAPEGQPMVALRTGRLSGAIGAGAAVASSSLPARNLVLEKPSYGPAADAEEDEDLAEDAKEINEAGLASFAELVGARSMAEMLEAAAAYATCVENRSHFTRPQLMRRMMASAGGKPVSREDGLRSFGTLLRTGRIEKVTRGHYSLAENSPYLAEARRLS
jgi:hypothetical protein